MNKDDSTPANVLNNALAIGLTHNHQLVVITEFDHYVFSVDPDTGNMVHTPTQEAFRYLHGVLRFKKTQDTGKSTVQPRMESYELSLDHMPVFYIETIDWPTVSQKIHLNNTIITYVWQAHKGYVKPDNTYAEWLESLKPLNTVIANDHEGDMIGVVQQIDPEDNTIEVAFPGMSHTLRFCEFDGKGVGDAYGKSLHLATNEVFGQIADTQIRQKTKKLFEDVLRSNFEGLSVDDLSNLYYQIQVLRGEL